MTAKTATLVFPKHMENRVREAMLASRARPEDEALAFLLCEKHLGIYGSRYVVKEWLVPRSDECVGQSAGGVSLAPNAHRELLRRLLESGLHPVHWHTHPGDGAPQFSSIDNHYESAYAVAMRGLPGEIDLISGVYNYAMTKSRFRLWLGNVTRRIVLQNSWFANQGRIASRYRTNAFDR